MNVLISNLLSHETTLKDIHNPFVRFYMYRANVSICDVDRSDIAKDVYQKLNWYTENADKNTLEPDTFFASSHNLTRLLFRKHDKEFYVDDFKNYCIGKGIDYNNLNLNSPIFKQERYLWMIEPSTMSYYDFIIGNSYYLAYIEATHMIGNFMIIPKKFGWKKASHFKECPITTLQFIQDNWTQYSPIYSDIAFTDWKKLFYLEDCYTNNELNSNLVINFLQSFSVIFSTLDEIATFVNKRTQNIVVKVNAIM